MNPEVKKRWTEALKSGQYEQGKGTLKTLDGAYCCLGVLCELYAQDHKEAEWSEINRDENTVDLYFDAKDAGKGSFKNRSSTILPHTVAEWAGIQDINPSIPVPNTHSPTTTLASLNDNGKPFEEIAEIIEEYI